MLDNIVGINHEAYQSYQNTKEINVCIKQNLKYSFAVIKFNLAYYKKSSISFNDEHPFSKFLATPLHVWHELLTRKMKQLCKKI